MSYQLNWEEKGVWANFRDVVSDQELNEVVSKVYGHKQFDSFRYLIADFLEVDSFDVTNKALRIIGATDRAAALTNPHIKVAIISDNVDTLDRIFSYEDASEGSPWLIAYFDNIKEARVWIAT